MNIITEEIKSCDYIADEYSYSLSASDGNILLHFRNTTICFNSYLVFKTGYPNEEIFIMEKQFSENDLRISTLYQIVNSMWIRDIKLNNRVHPRHKDEIFDRFNHYKIFFTDETFECIAKSYEIR